MEVTFKALGQLHKMLSVDENENPLKGIRLSIHSGRFSPELQISVAEKMTEGERIVSIDAITFFVDEATNNMLSGYIIDYNSNGFKLDYMLPSGRCCR